MVGTLVWKKNIRTALSDIMNKIATTEKTKVPRWVLKLFEDDKGIIENANKNYNALPKV